MADEKVTALRPLSDAELDAAEHQATAMLKEASTWPEMPAYLHGAKRTLALVAEVRRKRRLLSAAAAFVVPSDGYCRGCARTIGPAPHAEDCIVAEIEREAGA